MGRLHARLYRVSGGRFSPASGRCPQPPRYAGAPVMVLETVGRRSGLKRATPVLYLRDGDAFVALAANADRVWWAFVAMYPQAERYARFTDRELPVTALEPAGT